MEIEVLRKKISTFRGEGGRIRITEPGLYMEVLTAWEEWTGSMKEFYSALGVSQNGMASIIGKAKKMRREGQFPAEEFKEISVAGSGVSTPQLAPCTAIELSLSDGKVIRFPEVCQLIEFLKQAA